MARTLSAEAEALLREVEEAVELGSPELAPRLVRLARLAPTGSDAWAMAHRLLAEQVVTDHPWRASILVRRILVAGHDDDRAWALIGLAHSLLGHHRFAIAAYRQAMARAPGNPWYAHNLGHLIDIALDRPRDAVGLLGRAYRALTARGQGAEAFDTPSSDRERAEVRASYAHALLRAGEVHQAFVVMAPVMRRPGHRAAAHHHALYRLIVEARDGALMRVAPHEPRPERRIRKRRSTGVC
jgi:hypothetical protein